MKIHTTRFASIEIEPDDILFFRHGLVGFEDCRHWVLLADADNRSVAWLQSMQHSDIALPVVSPRRFCGRLPGFALSPNGRPEPAADLS